MACGCVTTINETNCDLNVSVCRGSFVLITPAYDGDFASISSPTYGTAVYNEEQNYVVYTQNVETTETEDSFFMSYNGGARCFIYITIEEGLQENQTYLALNAESNCTVGTPTYTWTIPDCAVLATGYTIHDQSIQVIVNEYDPEIDIELQTCTFTVDVCCGGNCNGCCTCQTIEWHPPICVTECGEDPDCYCSEPCYTYNPDTGNCEYDCTSDELCCTVTGIISEAAVVSIDNITVDCVDVQTDGGTGNLTDLTLSVTLDITGSSSGEIQWTLANPDTCNDPTNPCGVDWRLCGEGTTATVNSTVLTDSIVSWASLQWLDGVLQINMDGTWVDAYQNAIVEGAPNVPFNLFVTGFIDGYCESVQANYVISVDVVDFVCNTNVTVTTTTFMGLDLCHEGADCPEVTGNVNVCQECCDDDDCDTGICQDGHCKCPDGADPDPITGLCPCPEIVPACNTCVPSTTGYFLIPFGESSDDCTDFETFDYVTCTCKCTIGTCYNVNVTPYVCQECPECATLGSGWVQIAPDGSISNYGVSCPVCEQCVNTGTTNECVPIYCGTGQIPNPTPTTGITPSGVRCSVEFPCCCIDDPCFVNDCEECPSVEGCGCDQVEDVCVDCNKITCENGQLDCPYGCRCDEDTERCVYDPCVTYNCDIESGPQYCPAANIECGCDGLGNCVPCDTVECPIGDECPQGCDCVDGVCSPNPCDYYSLNCLFTIEPVTFDFELDYLEAGTDVTVTPTGTFLSDTILGTITSALFEWSINASNYELGFVPIADINTLYPGTVTTNIDGSITIDTTTLPFDYFQVRCEIVNTEVNGTRIGVTYRYQVLSSEEDKWKRALGSLCYGMYTINYGEGLSYDTINNWFIDGNNDDDPDISIAPINPVDGPATIVEINPGVITTIFPAFAGNQYLVITCSAVDEFTFTAELVSTECETITACGELESCPCAGTSNCDSSPTVINELDGLNWTVGVDFFDNDGNLKPWACEPISLLQFCGGAATAWDCGCGGLVPVEYASAALMPTKLCCNLDADTSGGDPWDAADSTHNNNYPTIWPDGSPTQCDNCCCGWAYSGVTITEHGGAYIKATINDMANAKICYQFDLSGSDHTVGSECCKFGCFTPPEIDCEDMLEASIDISCVGEAFEFSIDITNNSGFPSPEYTLELVNTTNPADCNIPCSSASGYDYCIPPCWCDGGPNCEVMEWTIPSPYPGFDPVWYTPYISGTVITTEDISGIFPLQGGVEQTIIVTDIATGCSTTVVFTPPCCDLINQVIAPLFCKTFLVGVYVVVTGFNFDGFSVSVTLDGIPYTEANFPNGTNFSPQTIIGSYFGDLTFGYGTLTGGGDLCPVISSETNWGNYDVVVTVEPINTDCSFTFPGPQSLCGGLSSSSSVTCVEDIVYIDTYVSNMDGGDTYSYTVLGCTGETTTWIDTNHLQITDCTNIDDVTITVSSNSTTCSTYTIVDRDVLWEIQNSCIDCTFTATTAWNCIEQLVQILVPDELDYSTSDFEVYTGGGVYVTTFTGLVTSFDPYSYSTSASNNLLTYYIVQVSNPTCPYSFSIDPIIDCSATTCGNEPSLIYDCISGFQFTDAIVDGVIDTAFFIDSNFIQTEIQEGDLVPNGSGIIWIIKDLGGLECTYILGFTNLLHSVEQIETTVGPTTITTDWITCGTDMLGDSLNFHITGGTTTFTLDSPLISASPVTLGLANANYTIPIDVQVVGPTYFTITSDVISCPITTVVEYTCSDPCENNPDLAIVCGGCAYQEVYVYENVDATTKVWYVKIDGSPIGSTLGGYIGSTTLTNYQASLYDNYGITFITVQPDPEVTNFNLYVIAPCCETYTTVEIGLGATPTYNNMVYSGQQSCDSIKTLFGTTPYINHRCCTCFTATKTGAVNSTTSEDKIQWRCPTIDNIWVDYDENAVECVDCEGREINFQRVITCTDNCRPVSETFLLEDSGDSEALCRLGIQGYLLVELENYGLSTIPSGTQFDLSWTGLGTSIVYLSLSNCLTRSSGAYTTTTADILPGGKFKFGARFNDPSCATNVYEVEITTADIDLGITPITISKSV